jgi:nitrite reductase/ring-hydroxylating ferredoxin subunit
VVEPEGAASTGAGRPTRRTVISTGVAAAPVVLAGGMVVANGVRFLNPRTPTRERELFVAFADRVPEAGTLDVVLPDGRRVQVRRADGEFAGFSNVCPHLGCRVAWQPAKDGETDPRKEKGYFRCPCHEGLFTPDGKAFSGPPSEAGQSLTRVPRIVRGGALYVQITEEAT